MKVAVCLSGFMRNYRATFPSLNHLILQPLQADLFISTWNVAGHSHRKWSNGKEPEEQISSNGLQKLYGDRLKSVNVLPLDVEVICPAWIKSSDRRAEIGIAMRRVAAMYFHVFEANKLKQLYEKVNGSYDVVIRLRPDLFFKYPLSAWVNRTEVRPNLIHTSVYERYGILNDQFMYGDSHTMDDVADLYEAIKKKSPTICQPHHGFCLFNPAEGVLRHYLDCHKIERLEHHIPYTR